MEVSRKSFLLGFASGLVAAVVAALLLLPVSGKSSPVPSPRPALRLGWAEARASLPGSRVSELATLTTAQASELLGLDLDTARKTAKCEPLPAGAWPIFADSPCPEKLMIRHADGGAILLGFLYGHVHQAAYLPANLLQ